MIDNFTLITGGSNVLGRDGALQMARSDVSVERRHLVGDHHWMTSQRLEIAGGMYL